MTEKCAHVFDIERFAVHDGPGIRTVVFLQGCPLRCPWCANPESWSIKPQLMYLESKCARCGRCSSSCPTGAIALADARLEIERTTCNGCGSCAEVCAKGAIQLVGKKMRISEIMDIIIRDIDYYRNSNGGVTLSGGEPFAQFDAAFELLIKCQEAGLHTAVETTGDVEPARFLKALPLVGLYLFDLKHCDAPRLRDVAGGDLNRILSNLSAAAGRSPDRVIIRVPVIPSFNDNSATINGIFQVALDNGVSNVHLLPYHTLGKNKFAGLGMKYLYDEAIPMLKLERLAPLGEIGRDMGLNVQIGG